jgi:hypothetical protein
MAIEPTLPPEEYGFYENLMCEEWVFAAEMCALAVEATLPLGPPVTIDTSKF